MIRNFRKSKYERVKRQRRPVPKPGYPIKPKTSYDRKKNKKAIEVELEEECISLRSTESWKKT